MPNQDADRNLLFGINALQNGLITRDALISAMNDWALAKHRSIGEILVEKAALDPVDRDALEAMIARRIANHRGSPAASLAVLSTAQSLASDLRRSIADPEVLESIAWIPTESRADPHATRAPDLVAPLSPGVRYSKVRDHAKGGLGVVFVARDTELNREVALKEIQTRHADDPTSRARFLVEAEITGGLEHPGIVPVYGLGHYDDGRPYYAMRFIRGDSLKEALAAFHADASLKDDPGARTLALRKLLRRFLDVCDAVAYAHSRGVLHRDLKPDNVMVGKYGETLVVDWGLAKSVSQAGVESPASLPEAPLLPSSSGSAETLPGSVIGTPAYMSPEQAAGRLDLLGPTSDVYSLGATLYTILTGQLPFVGYEVAVILRRVERGDFPRPREASPWLDPALEALCLKAMALTPESRYDSPRALADDLERWLADEPVAAFPEPMLRKARRWSRRHRTSLTTAVAASTVAAVLIGGFAWQKLAQRQRTDVSASTLLDQAERLGAEARATGKPADWIKAVAEARRAVDQLESGGGSGSIRREAEARLEVLRAEERMIAALDEARLRGTNVKDGHFDSAAKLDGYLAAFREFGVDVSSLPVEDAARRIRSSRIADALISALDDWSDYDPRPVPGASPKETRAVALAIVPSYDPKSVPGTKLVAIVRSADAEADPGRNSLRDVVATRDAAGLRRLCETQERRRELGPRLRYVFDSLLRLDPEASFLLLETILHENPSDFWMNQNLGAACLEARPPKGQEAARLLSVAVALRPESPGAHNNLGSALSAQGQVGPAILEYREAIRLRPDYAEAYFNLGNDLSLQGQAGQAVEIFRDAIRLKPDLAEAHAGLGYALSALGQFASSVASNREAIRLKPGYAKAHANLGFALKAQGLLDQAAASFRESIRLDPTDAVARYNLGSTLSDLGQVGPAILEYREAIRLQPDLARAHYNLGNALYALSQFEPSLAAYREAIRLQPDYAEAYLGLGVALYALNRLDPAIAAYREAIRLKPDYAEAHNNLANALRGLGQVDLAIASYREASRLKPDDALAHCNLGLILSAQGRFREALESFEKGHELGSKQPGWQNPSGAWVLEARRLVEVESRLPAILKGEATPKDSDERLALADLCYKTGRHATSVRFYDEAFADRPSLVSDLARGHRYNAACAASLASSGATRDDPPLDDSSRTNLREKARNWLRNDLSAWTKVLETGNPSVRPVVVQTLDHWKLDSDLAGIRDPEPLAKQSEAEREASRSLWADVEALRKKAAG